MENSQKLEIELDNAINEFDLKMNLKNNEYTNLGYNQDAILMMDELAKQTSELALKFRDSIIDYLK